MFSYRCAFPVRCGSHLTRNREGTFLKPLSSSVFEALKTVRILRRFRGQRGGQLKSSSCFSTWFFSSKFKVSANIVDVHKTPSVFRLIARSPVLKSC